MRPLKEGLDLERFFQELQGAEGRALLLDYDGTLAPFRYRREEAAPYPGVREILERMLEAGHTRLVVVSGRTVHDLIPLLGLARTPEIWGTHGWERLRGDGRYQGPKLDEAASRRLEQGYQVARSLRLEDRVERKPASVALHTRGMPPEDAAEIRTRVLKRWEPVAAGRCLEVHEFDGGLELRLPGRDKGDAVKTVLGEIERPVAAYLGDDATDEDAFLALGGRGLSVLVREELRPTAADLWLKPPEELIDFLRLWHRSCGAGP